jgi:hypothetical protein
VVAKEQVGESGDILQITHVTDEDPPLTPGMVATQIHLELSSAFRGTTDADDECASAR